MQYVIKFAGFSSLIIFFFNVYAVFFPNGHKSEEEKTAQICVQFLHFSHLCCYCEIFRHFTVWVSVEYVGLLKYSD